MPHTRNDRREFVKALLGGAAGLTFTWPAFGQGGAAPAPVVATKLTDRIAVVSGAGGNIGVIVGRDGVMMIDGGTANRAGDVAKAVAEVVEVAVGGPRGGVPARGGAADDDVACDAECGDDARPVEDGVPGGDRLRM